MRATPIIGLLSVLVVSGATAQLTEKGVHPGMLHAMATSRLVLDARLHALPPARRPGMRCSSIRTRISA